MFIDAYSANPQPFNDGAHINNGQSFGEVASALDDVYYEPGLLRPYIAEDGKRYVTLRNGFTEKRTKRGIVKVPKYRAVRINDLMRRDVWSPVFNATMMRRDSWIQIDQTVVEATRNRLSAWSDLVRMGSISGFDAMGSLTYEYQAMSDPGEAVVDMDTLADARNDAPLFKLRSVPLPITHSDFFFSRRQIAVSRRTGKALDMTMVRAAARRVAEMVERTTIGLETGITYGTRSGDSMTAHDGTSTVYGYTNFPSRVTKTDLTTPTGSNPEAIVQDVMEMIETMQTNGFYGPYMLYHSTPYSLYLNSDYFRSGSTSAVRTVRERLMEVDGLAGIRRLDYLTSGYQMILVHMDPEVAQAIDGMRIQTVMWESQGGGRMNFKVFCIQVPLFKAPYNGVAGIIHGTTS